MHRPRLSMTKRPAERSGRKGLSRSIATVGSASRGRRSHPTGSLRTQSKPFRRAGWIMGTFSLGLLCVIVMAATFSPLLALREISVSGTERLDSKEIVKALEVNLGTPLPLIDAKNIAESLAGFEIIESFSTTSLAPNGLHVEIIERQPICVIQNGGVTFLYDPAGVKLGKAKSTDKFPRVLITEVPSASLRFQNAIEVLLAMPAELLTEISVIEAKSKDNVSMVLRTSLNQKIIWGDSSDSALKSKVLSALIKTHRKSQSIVFDVSSPKAPVISYTNF